MQQVIDQIKDGEVMEEFIEKFKDEEVNDEIDFRNSEFFNIRKNQEHLMRQRIKTHVT